MNNQQPDFPSQLNADEISSLTKKDLFDHFHNNDNGLTEQEAQARISFYGDNTIEEKTQNFLLKFLSYFWGPIAWMIEVAAILSAVVHHYEDLIIILILLIFNAVVGFWQEYQASNAIAQLKKQLAQGACGSSHHLVGF